MAKAAVFFLRRCDTITAVSLRASKGIAASCLTNRDITSSPWSSREISLALSSSIGVVWGGREGVAGVAGVVGVVGGREVVEEDEGTRTAVEEVEEEEEEGVSWSPKRRVFTSTSPLLISLSS